MITIEFLITSLVVVLIPGTGVLYTINTGLLHKWRCGIWAALGCTLGIVPHLIAGILGLSAIMHLGARVFEIIKYIGVAYLLYLAWKTWAGAGKSKFKSDDKKTGALNIIQKGILLNILNPKLTLFFLSFLPQFMPPDAKNTMLPLLILSLTFMCMTFIIFIGYGLLASIVSDFIRKSKKLMKYIERGFAMIFAGLALKLALSKR